jgi:hypothetical protein
MTTLSAYQIRITLYNQQNRITITKTELHDTMISQTCAALSGIVKLNKTTHKPNQKRCALAQIPFL